MSRFAEAAILPETMQAPTGKNSSDTTGLANQLAEISGPGTSNRTLISSDDIAKPSGNKGLPGKLVPIIPQVDKTNYQSPPLQGSAVIDNVLPDQLKDRAKEEPRQSEGKPDSITSEQAKPDDQNKDKTLNKECASLNMNACLNDCKEDDLIRSAVYKLTEQEEGTLIHTKVEKPCVAHTMSFIEAPDKVQDGVTFTLYAEQIVSDEKTIDIHVLPFAGVEGHLETDKQSNVRYFVGKYFQHNGTDDGIAFNEGSVDFWLPLVQNYPASARAEHRQAIVSRINQAALTGDCYDHDDRKGMPPPPSMRK